MTVYFPDTDYPTLSGGFTVDGDLRGDLPFPTTNPQGWDEMRLQLISRYTNLPVDNSSVKEDAIKIFIRFANSRYTEFGFTYTGNNLQSDFASGLYDYKIWGTYIEEADLVEPFDSDQWTLIQEGECKLKTKTTNDMNRGNETDTVKYKTDPNTAESYVIYKS